ncbi:MAG: hypothetical protein BM556_10865 [Bacteriovorax sp. MedPE-SWde]|nr:MAG: hypothetical protein BM556_10865 [Bacteriovorax sp. MedPE-SWde]
MHNFTHSYCPTCNKTNHITNEGSVSSCQQCKEVIKYPECLNKSSYDLIVDINTKKTIPWWGWVMMIFMFFGFIVELCAPYAYPALRIYLYTDNGREKIKGVKEKLIKSYKE